MQKLSQQGLSSTEIALQLQNRTRGVVHQRLESFRSGSNPPNQGRQKSCACMPKTTARSITDMVY
jgi:hypothetical protein